MIEARISHLQRISFNEVAALPETKSEDVLIDGKKCALTTLGPAFGDSSVLKPDASRLEKLTH